MPQLPPLPSLRVFDAVVRHMSFTKAAVELAMTQSAVSYQIKTLEAFIGEALFSRQARSIALTPRGATLAPIVRLASRIGGFQLANSDLAVRLDVSNDLIDLAVGQADVAIRSGFGTWEGLRSHYLFRSRFAPFCSPSFIDKHGPIEKAADMVRLPLIAPDDEWWPIWFAAANAGAVVPPQQRGLITDRQPVIASAAIGGHGIGLLTRAYFTDDIKAGRLVQLFDAVGDDGRSFFLVYPEHLGTRPKIRAFRDWLLAAAKPVVDEQW